MLDQQVDDKGTDQEQAQRMLTTLRDQGFDGETENWRSRSVDQQSRFRR